MDAIDRTARRRRRRIRRMKQWARLAVPFLLLLAAGLLSAGVVRVVELGPRALGTEPGPEQEERTREELQHLDLEVFDEQLFWDQQRLQEERVRQRNDLTLDRGHGADATVESAITETFLDAAPAVGPIDPDDGPRERFEPSGPGQTQSSLPARIAPEPSSGLLVYAGLLMLKSRFSRLLLHG